MGGQKTRAVGVELSKPELCRSLVAFYATNREPIRRSDMSAPNAEGVVADD